MTLTPSRVVYLSSQHAPTCQVLGHFVLRKPFPGPGPAGMLAMPSSPWTSPDHQAKGSLCYLLTLGSWSPYLPRLTRCIDLVWAASRSFPRERTGGSVVRLYTSTHVLVCLHHHPVLLDGVVGFPTSIQFQIVEFSFRVLNALLHFLHFQCYYWNLDTIVFPDPLYKTCFIFSGTV